MCRAVQLPRANDVPNIIDWLDVAAERDTDVDLYRLVDTHELPGIREEVMNTENVWAYELDPSGLEDEADDSDEEMIEADESALLEKDDNVDERAGVVPVAGMSWSQPTLICLVPTSHPAGFAWRKHDQWRQLGYVKPRRCRLVVDNCRSARPMASRTLILCRVHLAFEDRRAVFRMVCSQLRKSLLLTNPSATGSATTYTLEFKQTL